MNLPHGNEKNSSGLDRIVVEINVVHTPTVLEPYNLIETVHMETVCFHLLRTAEELRHTNHFKPHSGRVVAYHIEAAECLFKVFHTANIVFYGK